MVVTELNAAKCTEMMTVRVRGLRLAALRMRAAAMVFRFGAFVAGCKIEIEL